MLNVITPYFNESHRIEETIAGLAAALNSSTDPHPLPLRFYWANDGSTDDSRRTLERSLSRLLPSGAPSGPYQIEHHFVDLPKNSGKASAMRAGIDACAKNAGVGQGEDAGTPENAIVAFWDADGELDAAGLLEMLREASENRADVVFGSRFNKRNPQVLSFRHYLGNKSLTMISNWFSDLNLSDVHCCARALKLSLLLRLPIRSTGFDFEAEFVGLIGRVERPALRLMEIPISYHPRTRAEGKKIGFRHVLPQIWQALRCRYFVPRVQMSRY